MGQLFTLGGDRIGSGQKQKVELHNYMMNSFNLEQDFKSSMAPGILYPFIKMIGTNHGTFDIDLDTFVRTLPTKGPLFGSFKLQIDLYSVPFRLYQGILHNNPVELGMNMNKVYLPKLLYSTIDGLNAPRVRGSNDYNYQVNESALLKYLGFSGAGKNANYSQQIASVSRKFQCVPVLAYYDIFKCYYSNKQEENAYVITPGNPRTANLIYRASQGQEAEPIQEYNPYNAEEFLLNLNNNWSWYFNIFVEIPIGNETTIENIIDGNIELRGNGTTWEIIPENILDISQLPDNPRKYQITIRINEDERESIIENLGNNINIATTYEDSFITADIALTPFNLKNIDRMRSALLKFNELGEEFVVGEDWTDESGEDGTGLPYSALFQKTTEGISWNAFEQNGLLVKTYQSDLFNNWLDTEFIDGPNGISAITAVNTAGGSFTMDSLNLAEKFYELLNRILVAGGTYQDWQEAVYGEGAVRLCETPMYIGGMSAEIMFEEVIATTENKSSDQALGSLGGKGTQVGKKGGNNIHVKLDEPGYVIGIASITPRICYSQGNDWDLTELDTLDDLHKPALDGIGFQPMMVEQLAWWNTIINPGGSTILHRDSYGKQIAWINYQTAVDKCFGDFAKQDGYAFMVLNRNYEIDGVARVKDITTYIDPAKYNYAFAYTDLSAQNFWVQIHSKVIARRKMGAQQIPNL